MSSLTMDVPAGTDPRNLNVTNSALPIARFLALNGWHLDHGRWVCGNHARTTPCEHQDSSGRLVAPYA